MVWIQVDKAGYIYPNNLKASLHMRWKTHVIGDSIMRANVRKREEHQQYSCVGSDALANEQSQQHIEELDEVFSRGIAYELHHAVLERTWKIVQEQIGKGSDLQGQSLDVEQCDSSL